jgi:mevalonate kinase
MLGWDYPTKGSLKNIIDTLGLYPITTLTSLTQQEKKQLLDKKIVLCMKVRDNHKILTDLGIKPQRLKMILKECEELCQQVDSQVTASIF